MAQRAFIQPVWGTTSRKLSSGLLDSAETLVDNLDELADVLDRLTEKYDKESHIIENGDATKPEIRISSPRGDNSNTAESNLFLKLKTCLDSARTLIGSLRKERDRLMKREMSVECRLGEIEDYKTHMKQDMSSLNEMVDLLSQRVQQLESDLVEQQENQEHLEAERDGLEDRLQKAKKLCSELNAENDKLTQKNKELLKERTNTSLKLENKELKYEVEVLIVENAKLKEMVRKMDDDSMTSCSEGDLGRTTSLSDVTDDSNNNTEKKKEVDSEEIGEPE